MDFAISPAQTQLVASVRRIGRAYGLDYWRQLDVRHQFPREMWNELSQFGLVGALLPSEHGGSGLGMLDLVMMVEALLEEGAGMPLVQLIMLNSIFGAQAISKFGSELHKRELLPKLIAGTALVSFALTEPDAGNNSINIRTVARSDGLGWCLSGQKTWISGHDEATHVLVVARTSPVGSGVRRTDGISMFLVDARRAGIQATPIEKAGTHPLSSFTLFLDNVRVEPHEKLGTLDGCWSELIELQNCERIVTAAGLVGTGRAAIRLAADYAKDRCVFGDRPIGSYQAVQFPLARCTALLNAAGIMNRNAAWLVDQHKPFGSEANTAKLLAADGASEACDRAMQAMGAMGYSKEFHVERLWRDARAFSIAPIPQELILGFIATHDLGLPRSY